VTDDVSRQFCDQFANSGQSVPPIGTFVQVAAGSNHSCALRADGTIACWGAGKKVGGTCVTADLECGQSIPPVEGGFVEVAAGYSHSCALRADGKVKCWGSNTGGRATPPVELQY
jgi:alpha-tubulin suppressor-like RCC1 family protein